jgi:hypothetical protein
MSILRIIHKAACIEWSWIVSATMLVEETRLRYLFTGSIPKSCYVHCPIHRPIKFRIPPFGNVRVVQQQKDCPRKSINDQDGFRVKTLNS